MPRMKAVTFAWIAALSCFCQSASRSGAAELFATSPFGAVVANAARERDALDPSKGNHLAMIGTGYDALLLRVHLIRHARTSIAIQTFIWTNDECGRLLMFELIEAARRGVKVRIVADHMFSENDPQVVAFLATVHPNLQIKHYRPAMGRMKPSLTRTLAQALRSFRDLNQRMHNKVMVFDDAILVTGGRNIENTYFDHSPEMNFRDRDVVAVGSVAQTAAASFEEFWNYRHAVASRELADVDAAITQGAYRRYARREDYDFGPHFATLDQEVSDEDLIRRRFTGRLKSARKVTFISDEPGKVSRSSGRAARLTQQLAETLAQAKTSIAIQSPYLVLSRPARALFREIQQRNPALQIRISSNSFASTDNLFAYSANYRLRGEYVEGLRLLVHEFKPHPASLPVLFPRYEAIKQLTQIRSAGGKPPRPPFLCLHAKSLVVDHAVAFIGSYNLDPRSENLNTEAGLLIEDERLAEELREEIEGDMRPENSWVIARRTLPLRLDALNGLVDGLLSLSPLDVWPIQNTSSFELRAGSDPAPPGDPTFYQKYREVGPFPGADGRLSTKEIITRLYKAVGTPLTPIF